MRTLFAIGVRVERMVGRVSTVAACILLPLLLGSTFLDVLRRAIPGIPGTATPLKSLQAPLFFGLVMLSLGWVYLRDGHVRIDALRRHLRPRARAVIELAGIVCFLLPLCVVLIWYGLPFAWDAWRIGEVGEGMLDLPVIWVVKSTIPAGALLLLLAGVGTAAQILATLLDHSATCPPQSELDASPGGAD